MVVDREVGGAIICFGCPVVCWGRPADSAGVSLDEYVGAILPSFSVDSVGVFPH